MYVKYRDLNTLDSIVIRDVRYFKLTKKDVEGKFGTVTHGAAICDGGIEWDGFVRDATVEALAGYLLNSAEEVGRRQWRKRDSITCISDDLEDYAELAWFNSPEAAQRVMDDLCRALARGERFFDLTAYGEDGLRRNGGKHGSLTRFDWIKTCELVAELTKREGVETHTAEPYQDMTVSVNGPAVVLVVID